jgi:hypothetical protein
MTSAATAHAVGGAEPGAEIGDEADGRVFRRRRRYEIEEVGRSDLV